MERLRGSEQKVGVIAYRSPDQIQPLLDRLEEVGIGHTGDASCFIDDSAQTLKLIDFATWDAMADLGIYLSTALHLPDNIRQRWSAAHE